MIDRKNPAMLSLTNRLSTEHTIPAISLAILPYSTEPLTRCMLKSVLQYPKLGMIISTICK